MRILAISGAPRRDGYTEELARLFADGAAAAGAEVEVVRLAERDVRPCRGCFACWLHPGGRCVQRDDMDDLQPRVAAADALVLATPIYFYAFSALAKTFLERLLPLTLPFIDPESVAGVERNSRRDPAAGPRRAVLIAAGAHRDPRLFAGLVETFATICHGLSIERAGVLLRPESYVLDFAAGKPMAIRKVRAAFAAAGRELVTAGRVAPETEADAAAPFTRDLELFAGHARAYWELARERGGGFDREALRDLAAADLRILVPELAASLDPEAAADLDAAVQFDVDGDPGGGFFLRIERGSCSAHRGRCARPTTTVALDLESFVALIRGTLDARAAVARKRIRVDGDRALFARLGRLFPRT
jgi:putative sterol carrier protein